MKRMNLLVMLILSIGLLVSIGFADPGPVSDLEFEDQFSLGSIPDGGVQEVAIAYTLFSFDPDGTVVSIDVAYSVFDYVNMDDLASPGGLTELMSIGFDNDQSFRVLECRSLAGCS